MSGEDPALVRKFPHAGARRAADAATDELPEDLPMSAHISKWLDVYYQVSKTLPKGQRP